MECFDIVDLEDALERKLPCKRSLTCCSNISGIEGPVSLTLV